MKLHFAALLVVIGLTTLSSQAQMSVSCKIKFSLAERDTLGNVNVGFDSNEQKWFEKKVEKQYPTICYADQKTNEGIWFYISVSTQNQDSATATTRTTPDGIGGTTSRTTVIPQTRTYPVYTLKIGRFHDGKLEVLRTFQRTKASSYSGTVIGLVGSFGNPEHNVILDGVNWLSSNEVPGTPPIP